jgi:tRNA G18 (ribose-2'-O)-methylase SpoU
LQIVEIESPDDPRIADYRDVRDGQKRDAEGLFLVEGRLNVKRLLCSRFVARSVFVSRPALVALDAALQRCTGPVFVAEPALLKRVVGYDIHRGCLAAAERRPVEPLATALERERETRGPQLWVAIEGVANPENVGGIFRNALAFGAGRLVLGPRCADPLYRKSVRVSMGAALRVPFATGPGGSATVQQLGDAGFFVVALSTSRDAMPLEACSPPSQRVALLLGSEAEGLPPQVLAAADARVTIPMAPGIDSLNAATAAGIALHRFARALGRLAGTS